MNRPPDQSEYADYYRTYTSQVPVGDIVQTIVAQTAEVHALFAGISEERSSHRYAPDKWTIREVASHINDTERVFTFRAFWLARVLGTDLPSFDQDAAIPTSGANDRLWASHVAEFQAVRAATLAFWKNLPADGWDRRGIASGNSFTVRALAWITAGHVAHHARLLRERYL